jgi:hypothetical protein
VFRSVFFGRSQRDGFLDRKGKTKWLLPFALKGEGVDGWGVDVMGVDVEGGKVVEDQEVTGWQTEV